MCHLCRPHYAVELRLFFCFALVIENINKGVTPGVLCKAGGFTRKNFYTTPKR
jgi:hypothetical protein